MKRQLAKPLTICLLCLLLGQQAFAAPVVLTAYLYDPCGGCAGIIPGCGDCEEELALSNRLSMLLTEPLNGGSAVLRLRNMLDDVYQAEYLDILAQHGEAGRKNELPMFTIGEGEAASLLFGEAGIEALPEALDAAISARPPEEAKDLPVYALTRRDDPSGVQPGDSVIVYFYKEACPYCLELAPLIEALPDTITLPDGETSAVRFLALNKNIPEEMAVVQAYYEALDIAEERQLVPMMIIGDTDLFLYEEIVPQLLPLLLGGDGTGTPLAPFAQLMESTGVEERP